jgi:hypothetical protein
MGAEHVVDHIEPLFARRVIRARQIDEVDEALTMCAASA